MFGAVVSAVGLALYADSCCFVAPAHPSLQAYLREQRPQPNVASLVNEADNIPAFGRSRILVSREFLFAYNKPYYEAFQERAAAVIQALLATDRGPLDRLSTRYGATHILLAEETLSDLWSSVKASWVSKDFPHLLRNLAPLEQGRQPIVSRVAFQCTVYRSGSLLLTDLTCLREAGGKDLASEGL
jgi:hypothetical protein